MGLSPAIDRRNTFINFIMDRRTFPMDIEILTMPMDREKTVLYKVDGSIIVFKFFFHNLEWIKVRVIFYYAYRGFGDRPKSASFSIFFRY